MKKLIIAVLSITIFIVDMYCQDNSIDKNVLTFNSISYDNRNLQVSNIVAKPNDTTIVDNPDAIHCVPATWIKDHSDGKISAPWGCEKCRIDYFHDIPDDIVRVTCTCKQRSGSEYTPLVYTSFSMLLNKSYFLENSDLVICSVRYKTKASAFTNYVTVGFLKGNFKGVYLRTGTTESYLSKGKKQRTVVYDENGNEYSEKQINGILSGKFFVKKYKLFNSTLGNPQDKSQYKMVE